MEEAVGLSMGRPPVGVGVQGLDDGSVDSSDDDGNVGVRYVDSGSDDSDIDVVPTLERPLWRYGSVDSSDDDEEPTPSEDDEGSVPLMPSIFCGYESSDESTDENHEPIPTVRGLGQGTNISPSVYMAVTEAIYITVTEAINHRSQCTAPATPPRRNNNLVVREIHLADLAISEANTYHIQLPGVQWTHIRRPRPNSDNSSFRRIETIRSARYGPHQDRSCIAGAT